jgi:tagatose 6-phosphate kinase
MILCVGATPAVQRVMVFEKVELDQVNRAHITIDGIAGKAINVAKALKLLGESPLASGFLGGARGAEILAELKRRAIQNEFIEVSPNTRQCTTVIDQAAGTQTELVEESQAVPDRKYHELLGVVKSQVAACKALVMSGTLTPKAPQTFYRDCLELANAAGILTILDAKGGALDQALQARPGVVKPNRAELSGTTGRDISDEQSCIVVMRSLFGRGAQRVIVTHGKNPTLAFDGNTVWRISAPAISTINPIGSGDSFTAALTVRLLRGDDLGEACRWGTAAGAANALTLMPAEFEASAAERLAPMVNVERLSPV